MGKEMWYIYKMDYYTTEKNSLQFTIPGNLDNSEDPKETYMDLISMGSRKRQDLLSKLRAWGLWERIGRERRGREGGRKKITQ